MAIIPKISTGSIKSVVTSHEVVAVASALVIAPLVAPIITRWMDKVPFLSGHKTLALVIIGIGILLISSKIGQGFFRAVAIGIGASSLILAVFPYVMQYIKR